MADRTSPNIQLVDTPKKIRDLVRHKSWTLPVSRKVASVNKRGELGSWFGTDPELVRVPSSNVHGKNTIIPNQDATIPWLSLLTTGIEHKKCNWLLWNGSWSWTYAAELTCFISTYINIDISYIYTLYIYICVRIYIYIYAYNNNIYIYAYTYVTLQQT